MEYTTSLALPSQGTRLLWSKQNTSSARHVRDSHPPLCPIPGDAVLAKKLALLLYYKAQAFWPDSNSDLVVLHSPLLNESCFVSSPPLTYMLKFSGFSELLQISDQRSHILNAVKALENTKWFSLTSLTELNTYLKWNFKILSLHRLSIRVNHI